MVEVFKTNVENRSQAGTLLFQLHESFPDYRANFDLEDCDNILRVACTASSIQPSLIIKFLKDLGVDVEVLPDDDCSLNELVVNTHLLANRVTETY